jgi:two-component system LytT family sensor kinase
MKKSAIPFKKLLLVGRHLVFWVVAYFFYAYFLGYGSTNTAYVNMFTAFLMPVTILISYLFSLYLIPKYLLKKKYGHFVLYSVYTFILSVYGIIVSILYGLLYTEQLKLETTSPLTKTLPFIVLGVFFVVLIFVTLHLTMVNYKSIVANENLSNKILNAQLQLKEQELKLLKMQIHPHFLFNALNTIYGLALKRSENTPDIILKLSNLLDYILYQVNKPKVRLIDEVTHIREYMELEKIRFQDTLEVVFEADHIAEDVEIAPMILIPFVENAFKHGQRNQGPLKIFIHITFTQGNLTFTIKNTIGPMVSEQHTKGIGLLNIQKRLSILYKDHYTLHMDSSSEWYTVHLTINQLKTS